MNEQNEKIHVQYHLNYQVHFYSSFCMHSIKNLRLPVLF